MQESGRVDKVALIVDQTGAGFTSLQPPLLSFCERLLYYWWEKCFALTEIFLGICNLRTLVYYIFFSFFLFFLSLPSLLMLLYSSVACLIGGCLGPLFAQAKWGSCWVLVWRKCIMRSMFGICIVFLFLSLSTSWEPVLPSCSCNCHKLQY